MWHKPAHFFEAKKYSPAYLLPAKKHDVGCLKGLSKYVACVDLFLIPYFWKIVVVYFKYEE